MIDDFEIFEAKSRPRRLKPDEVSLTKTNIVVSEALNAQLGETRRVLLMFQKERRLIAIRPIQSEDEGYKLSCRSISSRAFYLFFDIHERGRFRGSLERGMIVVDLRNGRLT